MKKFKNALAILLMLTIMVTVQLQPCLQEMEPWLHIILVLEKLERIMLMPHLVTMVRVVRVQPGIQLHRAITQTMLW